MSYTCHKLLPTQLVSLIFTVCKTLHDHHSLFCAGVVSIKKKAEIWSYHGSEGVSWGLLVCDAI